jgi:hypothetical protein
MDKKYLLNIVEELPFGVTITQDGWLAKLVVACYSDSLFKHWNFKSLVLKYLHRLGPDWEAKKVPTLCDATKLLQLDMRDISSQPTIEAFREENEPIVSCFEKVADELLK